MRPNQKHRNYIVATKTLFIGGIKSGKSRLAEAYILQQFDDKQPFYLATSELIDDEIKQRVKIHRDRRKDAFITWEEPLKLLATLQRTTGPVLVECISMWLNNALYYGMTDAEILDELAAVMQIPIDMVLVHNEVGLGVIPDNPLARRFVDLSGKAAQLMGQHCRQVFFCSAGFSMALK